MSYKITEIQAQGSFCALHVQHMRGNKRVTVLSICSFILVIDNPLNLISYSSPLPKWLHMSAAF